MQENIFLLKWTWKPKSSTNLTTHFPPMVRFSCPVCYGHISTKATCTRSPRPPNEIGYTGNDFRDTLPNAQKIDAVNCSASCYYNFENCLPTLSCRVDRVHDRFFRLSTSRCLVPMRPYTSSQSQSHSASNLWQRSLAIPRVCSANLHMQRRRIDTVGETAPACLSFVRSRT